MANKKQGKVKAISITAFIKGMQVVKLSDGKLWVGTVTRTFGTKKTAAHVNWGPQLSIIGIEMCKQLVVEYVDGLETRYRGESMASISTISKQLPLKYSQWQSAIDNGEVNSDKIVEFEIIEGIWKSKSTTYDQPDREWFEKYETPIAKIIPAKKKMYTEDELREIALEAFKQGIRWSHNQFSDAAYNRFRTWYSQK